MARPQRPTARDTSLQVLIDALHAKPKPNLRGLWLAVAWAGDLLAAIGNTARALAEGTPASLPQARKDLLRWAQVLRERQW